MFDRVCRLLLRVLRVPPEPEPPFGAAESIRVFRAAPNYYKLRLLGWGLSQLFALAGIVFWVVVLHRVGDLAPAGVRILLIILEVTGLVGYLMQLPLTYAKQRLDYELRWYVVTDRSLRIRSGIWGVQEMTMSFANLQQILVTQGPLQRLLGLADVRVHSAGGGGGHDSSHQAKGPSLHTGFFHGVSNAEEIRDLIVERLRHFRETGLGDPDEQRGARFAPSAEDLTAETRAAVNELLAEARALRETLTDARPETETP